MTRWSEMLALGLGLVVFSGCGSDDAREPRDEPTEEETVYEEHFPEGIVVTAPARGAFISAEMGNVVTVTGSGARADLTINGQPVTPDDSGAFAADVPLGLGLNLITVADGEGSVETPVVFGHFAPTTQAVPGAVALRVNPRGFANDDPNAMSLTEVAQSALNDVDLLAPLKGQTLTGSIPGGSWNLHVWKTVYAGTSVQLSPAPGGAAFTAKVHDVEVYGTLTIDLLFTKTDEVVLSADAVHVTGNVMAGLEGTSLSGSAPNTKALLQGFNYDSGNAGLPCCVDGILTDYLRPKVQEQVQTQVRDIMSTEVAFALEQFALPPAIDLTPLGFDAAIGIDTYLDGAFFDASGATLTAAAKFAGAIQPGEVGETAPGWLAIGQPVGPQALDPAFGVSVSLDALNQALHAAWAQDGLRRMLHGLPMVDTVLVEPRLPPMVLPNPDGTLSARAGEVVLHATFQDVPIQAAVNVIGDVAVQLDPQGGQLLLAPGPQPTVSVTWLLYEGVDDGMRKLIKSTIIDMVPTLLTPISLPLPTLPLGAISPSLAGMAGALAPSSSLGLAPETARLELYGDLMMTPVP